VSRTPSSSATALPDTMTSLLVDFPHTYIDGGSRDYVCDLLVDFPSATVLTHYIMPSLLVDFPDKDIVGGSRDYVCDLTTVEVDTTVILHNTIPSLLVDFPDKEAVVGYVYHGGRGYCRRDVTIVEVDTTVTSIEANAFNSWTSVWCIRIPHTVSSIGNFAFMNCSSLTSITLPPTITTIGGCAFYGCSSLRSINFPENLFAISYNTFELCSKLRTITTSAFSTTTLDKSLNGFKNFLVKAGFFPENPIDILYGFKHCDTTMYYNWRIGTDGRLPLFTAARRSLKWCYVEKVFTAQMPAIHGIDVLSGLPAFMLAAAGLDSDIESVYNLLKEYPAAMSATYIRKFPLTVRESEGGVVNIVRAAIQKYQSFDTY